MEKEAEQVLNLFKENKVEYQLYEHPPVYTSEEAAKVRGMELRTGCKSMVMKTKEEKFIIANIAADRKIDIKKLEKIVGTKELKFATKEEVLTKTKCESGSVHPFGRLFGLETYLDRSVLDNESVNFNIGMLTKSVRIRKDDLVELMKPEIGNFSKG